MSTPHPAMPGVTNPNVVTTDEQWRTVAGFPDYAVSDRGRVVSFKGRQPRVLTRWDNEGYAFVTLRGDGRRKSASVHGLVARAFIGPRPDGLEIRHLNGDPLDCSIGNLRYGTHAENQLDQVAHGTHPQASKTHCPRLHEYTPANTYVIPSTGGRTCRACKRIRDREYLIRRALRAAAVPTAA